MTVCAEVSAALLLIEYWTEDVSTVRQPINSLLLLTHQKVNKAVWIVIILVVIFLLNIFGTLTRHPEQNRYSKHNIANRN